MIAETDRSEEAKAKLKTAMTVVMTWKALIIY